MNTDSKQCEFEVNYSQVNVTISDSYMITAVIDGKFECSVKVADKSDYTLSDLDGLFLQTIDKYCLNTLKPYEN